MAASLQQAPTSPARGRWAPSPTGQFHLGNARTALVAWLSIRLQGGTFIWRVEDLDQPRTIAGLAEKQQEELLWLGLDWDEGADISKPDSDSFFQSERDALYLAALRRLEDQGQLFPCQRSRREILEVASAPHGNAALPYPASLRPDSLAEGWLERALEPQSNPEDGVSIRFRVDPREVVFRDSMMGEVRQQVDQEVGDFVVRRRDGAWAYQLAVVVDDIEMSISEVVRGADLLDSTARQILLFEALGATPPAFGHVPLMLNPDGSKLSKRDRATHLWSLRETGVAAETVVGYLAASLHLSESERPTSPYELLEKLRRRSSGSAAFWSSLNRRAVVVPDDISEQLRQRTKAP